MNKILWNVLLLIPTLTAAGFCTIAAVSATPLNSEAARAESSLSSERLNLEQLEQPAVVRSDSETEALSTAEITETITETELTTAEAQSSSGAVPTQVGELSPDSKASSEPATTLPPAANSSVSEATSNAFPHAAPPFSQTTRQPNQTRGSLGQVTSVSQLSDVQPTDWAFQALQSLVERYGCIVGYPDSTYQGDRALSRYEFAAGLNACLDRISELIATSTADLAAQADLATLQRLQEEFAAELATLRGRVDALEARTTELEANQFSTTTKLNGDAFFVVADVFGDDIDDLNETVVQHRYRIALDTSFSGTDRLRARLQDGNVRSFIQPGNETNLAANTNTNGRVLLDDLSYLFSPTENVQVLVQLNAMGLDSLTFGNTINAFDVGAPRGAVSRFGQRPPIYRFGGADAGLGFNFRLNDVFSVQLGYASGEADNPAPGSGLFNGNYNLLGQITARNLFGKLDLALTYVNTYLGTTRTTAGILAGLQTGTGSLASAVDADRPIAANSYGIEANFKVSPGFQIGGWAGFSAIRAIELGDADVWNYAITLAFPDLGGEGNLGGILVGVQPRLTGTSSALGEVLGLRKDPDTGLHLEAFYRLALNDNVDITPGVFWLTAPNHDNDNADVLVGVLRMTFRF